MPTNLKMRGTPLSLLEVGAASPASEDARYVEPAPRRYADSLHEDEGDFRFNYENGRRQMYAKNTPVQRLSSVASNSKVDTPDYPSARSISLPSASKVEGGALHDPGPEAATISASCPQCQGCLSCVGDPHDSVSHLFCQGCNERALGAKDTRFQSLSSNPFEPLRLIP